MAVGHIKVRTLKDGSRRYQARIPSPGNRRKDIVRTFIRKGDAERWLAAQATAMATGEFIDPSISNRPFSQLVEVWEQTRAAGLAPKTRERYGSITRVHLLPAFGTTKLARLDRVTIKAYFAACELHPGTARKVQVVLSSILSEGIELGWLRDNPAARLRLPSSPRKAMIVLTAIEVRALSQHPARPADRLAILTAAYTGLRAGELWALTVGDFHPVQLGVGGARLVVQRTLTSEHGHLIFRNTTKTDKTRVISLPQFLANMLQTHIEDRPKPQAPTDLLFPSPGGPQNQPGPMRHELFVRRVFRPAIHQTLPPNKQALRFHDLRHTCASLLADAGVSILLVSQRLGHSSVTTTLDRYSHLYPSAEEALASTLDAMYNASDPAQPIDLDSRRAEGA